MVTKLVALYKKPADVPAFEKNYHETHLPLVHKMPGLLDVRLTYLQRNVMGGEAPYYMIAELLFKDEEALKAALSSPEGKAAGANVMGFAGSILTMTIAEEASNTTITV